MRVGLPERTRPTPVVAPSAALASSSRPPVPEIEKVLADLEGQLSELRGQVRQAQQLAGLGTAAATLAHEINNLLTPIISYADSALKSDNARLKEKALAVTLKNASMLVAMSERILEIGAAKRAQRQLVSVRQTAFDAVESLGRDPAKDCITFVNDVDETIVACCDPLQLRQLLFNLFLNARDVMAPNHGGRLTVRASDRAGLVAIEVTDTGGGIDPDRLPHIFDPLHSSKISNEPDKARCKGLGLALCRDLAQENGGTITVSSDPGVGTTFIITLASTEPDA